MNWGVGDFQFLKSGSDEPCIQPIESSQLPGYYTFRFAMGERHGPDWQAITPRRWPSQRGGWPEFRQLLARIAGTPLPLADWAQRNFD
ncbi:integral membrane domain protein [Bordetella holmesii 1058]|uniref:Integral membrane domain protein n=1 Tax=Bordetella holmesii 1058 TaxID=1247648 RepID=A0ABN0RX72_9BORD|nr:integral membrane domain protein [Bordetella holmesii 1058]